MTKEDPDFEICVLNLYQGGWNCSQISRFLGRGNSTIKSIVHRPAHLRRKYMEMPYGTPWADFYYDYHLEKIAGYVKAGVDAVESRGPHIGSVPRIPHHEYEQAAFMYTKLEMSAEEIAPHFGVHPSAIRQRLKHAGVKLRSRGEAQRLARRNWSHEYRVELAFKGVRTRGGRTLSQSQIDTAAHLYQNEMMSGADIAAVLNLGGNPKSDLQLIMKALARAGVKIRNAREARLAAMMRRSGRLAQAA